MHNTPEKRRAYLRNYTARNRAKIASQRITKRAERRAWAITYLGGKCAICSSTIDLHFDHIDPTTKATAISNLCVRSLARLQVELAKCQLLCANCHRTKTSINHEYHPAPDHGSSTMYNDHHCRCELCRTWKYNYDKEWKRNRLTTPPAVPPDKPHGTGAMYQYYHCRCELCKAWNKAKSQKYYRPATKSSTGASSP